MKFDIKKALETIELFENEKIIEKVSAKFEEIVESPQTHELVTVRRHKGYLFLTTDRIIFISQKEERLVRLYYEQIKTVDFEDIFDNWVNIETKSQNLISFRVEKSLLEDVANKIQGQIVKKIAEAAQEQKAERIHIVVDFSFLRPLAEKGVVIHALTCPHCGAKISELPSSGDFFDCIYCGSKIFASDINQEINRLLGYSVENITTEGSIKPAKPVICKYFDNNMCKYLMGSKLAEIRVSDGCRSPRYATCCLICTYNRKCDIGCNQIY